VNKEELEDLLSIGCCKYHEEIGEKAKKEIERLNNKVEELMTLYTTERYVKEDYKNIIKEIKSQLDYLETYSSKEDVYEDMARRLNNIEKIIGDSSND